MSEKFEQPNGHNQPESIDWTQENLEEEKTDIEKRFEKFIASNKLEDLDNDYTMQEDLGVLKEDIQKAIDGTYDSEAYLGSELQAAQDEDSPLARSDKDKALSLMESLKRNDRLRARFESILKKLKELE